MGRGLSNYERELDLLFYSLSSARIFFRADQTAAEEAEAAKETGGGAPAADPARECGDRAGESAGERPIHGVPHQYGIVPRPAHDVTPVSGRRQREDRACVAGEGAGERQRVWGQGR